MVVIYKPGVELTIDEMRANAQAYTTLTTKLPLPFLADIRGVKSADKGARQWGSSPEAKEITLASAILTGSLMSKMIGNIFYQLNKPPYPFRMFTNRNEAVAWLKQFMD